MQETDWDVVFVGTAFKQYQIKLTFGNGTWLGTKCQGSLTWFHSSESMEQCLFDLVRLSTGLGKHMKKTIYLGRSNHSEAIWTQLRFSGHFCLPFQSSHRSLQRDEHDEPIKQHLFCGITGTTIAQKIKQHFDENHKPCLGRSPSPCRAKVNKANSIGIPSWEFSIGFSSHLWLPEGIQVLAWHSPIFHHIPRYWHVTVGKNFGCHAVHEKQRFVGLPLVRGFRRMGINRIHWVIINKRRSVHSVLDPQVMVTIDKQGGTKLTKLLFQIAI